MKAIAESSDTSDSLGKAYAMAGKKRRQIKMIIN
jgi:hypothetical protein